MDVVVLLLIVTSHIVAFALGYSLRAYISSLHRSYH
jgi:hypothetical protein